MNELMTAVERVVRPVRARAPVKDRMREELLAHLTAVYDAERASLGDDRLALAQAVRRLGDPADLTRDLQATVGRGSRFDAAAERWFGRWGGESDLRYAARLAGFAFLVWAVYVAVVVLLRGSRGGVWADAGTLLRVMLAFVAVLSASFVPVLLAYYRVREAACGGPGAARSRPRAAAWAAAGGAVPAVAVVGFSLLCGLDPSECLPLLRGWVAVGVFVAVVLVGHARLNGPRQLRHAEWERLTIPY